MNEEYKLKIGQNVFVMTDTHYWVGRLVDVDGPFTVVIDNVYWVASTGRLGEFTRNGMAQNMELEKFHLPWQRVNYRTISPWTHPLPESTFPVNNNE